MDQPEVVGAARGGGIWKAHSAMVVAQFLTGGHHVISKVALNVGVNQFVFCLYRDLIAVSILAPLAFFTERRVRPPMTREILASSFLLGLTGIFGNQLLFLIGLGYTNPSYAAALQPAIPVYTFVFALMMGTETLNLLRMEGQTKLGGVVVCVSGALLMALFRGPALIGYDEPEVVAHYKLVGTHHSEPVGWLMFNILEFEIDHWTLGALCLIGASICMSLYIAIQAPVLKKYPASLSLTACSYLFAALLMVVTALFMGIERTDWILTKSEIIAVLYAGIIASALIYGLVTWSNKILGPALVAIYYPLQPAASTFLSTVFLGSPIYLGSVLGAVLIIAGVYLVTWAAHRERQAVAGVNCRVSPPSESLLHCDPSLHEVLVQNGHLTGGSSVAKVVD